MKPESDLAWYSVRCVLVHEWSGEDDYTYEERVTLWHASSAEVAIERAEEEVHDYAASLRDDNSSSSYVGLAQCYWIADDVSSGAEIFSLMRDSALEPDEYLTRFFDTGSERQRTLGD